MKDFFDKKLVRELAQQSCMQIPMKVDLWNKISGSHRQPCDISPQMRVEACSCLARGLQIRTYRNGKERNTRRPRTTDIIEQTITDQILRLLEMVALMPGFKHTREVFRLQAKPVGLTTRGAKHMSTGWFRVHTVIALDFGLLRRQFEQVVHRIQYRASK
jgi:hypothetical protein